MKKILSFLMLLATANSFAQQVIVKENKDTLVLTTVKKTVTYSYDTVIQTLKIYNPPATNQPPIARAGNDATLTIPAASPSIGYALNGSASSDPEGAVLKYFWRKVTGPAATLTDTNKVICQVTNMTEGVYDFELRAVDPLNAFSADHVIITVKKEVVGGTTIPFSFTQLPISDPDLNRAGAGAEQWHDRNDVNLGYTPQDVYYRFVATRIATATKGVYNWSYFDGLINAAISRKQKFSFGIMTVYPEGTTGDGLVAIGNGTAAYPLWLQSAMNGEWLINGTWIPNYNDPAYLAWVLELNQAIYSHIQNTSFNGVNYKSVINSIDIRSYGSWGEWHSCCTVDNFTVSMYPAGTFPTASSLKKIVDAYTQGFPDIQLSAMIAGYDAQWLNNTYNPPEIAYYLLTQRNQKGMIGWRRDQWGATDGYLTDYLENNNRSYNGLTFKDSIMPRYKTAPVTGEPPAWIPNDYADLENQIRRYHATSFGNGNYGTNTPNSTIQSRVKASSKAAGYRIIATGGSFIPGSASISITMNWQNIGLSPTYDNWDIYYELVSSTGVVTQLGKSTFKLRLLLPSNTATSHTDSFGWSAPTGTNTLRMVIKDVNGYRQPLYLQIQGRNSSGGYDIKSFQR